jgi:hypothetical protein
LIYDAAGRGARRAVDKLTENQKLETIRRVGAGG